MLYIPALFWGHSMISWDFSCGDQMSSWVEICAAAEASGCCSSVYFLHLKKHCIISSPHLAVLEQSVQSAPWRAGMCSLGCVCMCVSCMHVLSHVPIFVTPWSVACQAPLEWVGIPFSRGSSQPRVRTQISFLSCVGRRILYHWHIYCLDCCSLSTCLVRQPLKSVWNLVSVTVPSFGSFIHPSIHPMFWTLSLE